ncbi:MAG: hypothetical protein RL458_269, partial [Pseudomonadota bacterium]
TAHTASLLQFPAAALQGAGVLRLSLTLPDSLTLASGEGLIAQAQSGDGVTVVAGATARAVTLEGSASDLASFLATEGRVRYTGPAGAVSGDAVSAPVRVALKLSNAAGESAVDIDLVAPSQPSASLAGLSVKAPAGLPVTPGALVPLTFATDAIAGSGQVSVRLVAQTGATLHWVASSVLKDAQGAALAAGSGSTLTLVGSASQLNAWLSGLGSLRVAAVADSAVDLTVQAGGSTSSAGVISSGSIPIDYRPAEGLINGPALNLAQAFTVPVSGHVRFAPDAIAGDTTGGATLRVTLGVQAQSTEAAAPSLAWLGDASLIDGSGQTLAAGSGATLTLAGTAAQLNAFLSSAGALRYEGATAAVLSVEVSRTAQGVVARASAQSTLVPVAAPAQLPVLSVTAPADVLLDPSGNTPLVFEQLPFAASSVTGALTVSLVAPAGGQVNAQPGAGIAIETATDTQGGKSRAVTRVSGSLAALNSYFRSFGSLVYVIQPGAQPGADGIAPGNGSLQLSIQSGAARASVAITMGVSEPVASPGLALPASVQVVSGAVTPLQLGTDRLTFAADALLELVVGTTAGGELAAAAPAAGSTVTVASQSDDARVSASTVVLRGTANDLDTFISQGKLTLRTEAPRTVSVAVASVLAPALKAAGSVSVTLASAQGLQVSPTLAVPERIILALAGDTAIVLPATGMGAGGGLPESTAAVLSLRAPASGQWVAVDDDAAAGNAGNADGVLVDTATVNGRSVLTLSGTVAALNTWLSTAGNLAYSGSAGLVDLALDTGSVAAPRVASATLSLESQQAVQAPRIVSLPTQLAITAGTRSTLAFDGAALSAGALSSAQLTLSLSLPAQAQLPLAAGEGLSFITAQGAVIDGKSGLRTLVLQGTASQLQGWLAASADRIAYTGPATDSTGAALALQVSVASASGKAEQAVTLAAPAQPSGSTTGARLTLPAGLIATVGARVPLVLGALLQSAAGTDAVVLDIEAPASRLSLALTEGVTASSGASFQLSGADTSYTATRLSGSVAALNNFFSQPGAAWYDSSFAATLKMRVVGSVASAGAIAITTKPAAEAPVAGPTLAIPASFAVPTLGGDIRFAPNAIGGSGSLTVTVSASTGTLSVFNDDAVEVGGTPNLDGVLIGGTALARTFTGTATALNAYLSAAGKLRYSGAATALAISVASDSTQGQVVTAAGESTLTGLSSQLLAPALALNAPAQLAVAQGTNTTALIFAQGAVSASASSDALTLTLTAPAGGTLHWAADSALKASSTASTTLAASTAGANSLTLFGTAAQINAYLTSPAGSIRYSGASGTLAIEAVQGTGALRATSQIAMAAVPMQVSPGLTLPQSLNVVAGESTPLLASVDPVAFAGSGNLSVTVSVASGSLAADLAGLASPPTITPVTTSGRTTSLTITGSPSAIDTLFADGRVRLVATAADTVQVSVQSVSVSALRADGS